MGRFEARSHVVFAADALRVFGCLALALGLTACGLPSSPFGQTAPLSISHSDRQIGP